MSTVEVAAACGACVCTQRFGWFLFSRRGRNRGKLIDRREKRCYSVFRKGATDDGSPDIMGKKITASLPDWGGYFFVVLLLFEPIANPRPNEVKQRLSTAIKSAIVSISESLLSKISKTDFYVIGAINSPQKRTAINTSMCGSTWGQVLIDYYTEQMFECQLVTDTFVVFLDG